MGSNSTCGSPRNLRATRDPRSALRLRGTGRRGQQGVRLSEIRERREIREGESGREGIMRSRQDREGINSSAARSASDARSAKGSPRSPGPMSCRDRQRPSDLTACGCSSAWGAAPSGQALRASSCLLAPFGASAALLSPPVQASSRQQGQPSTPGWPWAGNPALLAAAAIISVSQTSRRDPRDPRASEIWLWRCKVLTSRVV